MKHAATERMAIDAADSSMFSERFAHKSQTLFLELGKDFLERDSLTYHKPYSLTIDCSFGK
jgi:hypothetical protein